MMKSRYLRSWWIPVFLIIATLALVAYIVIPANPPTIASDDWTTGEPMPTARSEIVATALDGKIYVVGGLVGAVSGTGFGALNVFEVYDIETDQWESLSPIPFEDGLHHTTIAATGEFIYVTGGHDGGDFDPDIASTWRYDPVLDEWTQLPDMPAPRAAHAMANINDQLYVVGGEGPRPEEVWRYLPETDEWETVTISPTQREHLSAVGLDGKLYVIGGRWHNQGNLATLEVYDLITDEWTQLADMPTPRSGLTAAIVDGKIHVTGGEALDSAITFREHEVYDPATTEWTSLPDLPTPRHGLASASTNDKWFVIGGATGAGFRTIFTLQTVVEVYTPHGTGQE